MPPAPNILFVHSDQHRFDTLGANGHPLVRTPHLDRLAREGINFSHAFSTIPICCPARASLMTGSWPSQHGCVCNPGTTIYRPARPDLPVLTDLLKTAGYRIGWIGRFHREVAGSPTDYGVDDYVPAADYNTWRKAQGIPSVESDYFGCVDERCPPDQTRLAWQADGIIRRLNDAARDRTPFFLRWDPSEPHLPCRPTKCFADLYAPDTIPPWPSWPDPMEHKPPVQRRQRRIWNIEDWPWERWQPVVARYLAVISELDHHLGRILHRLDELGLAGNTLVIYTPDHGDFCGGHGLIDKHYAMYDDIMHVPLLIRWPDRISPGRVSDAFVSNEIDVARTLLSAAGVTPPASFVGQDLVAVGRGDAIGRDDLLGQYFGGETGGYDARMIRDRRFKFVYNPTSIDELYDLERDPGERDNRIDDQALDAERRRLVDRLQGWMAQVGDPLFNGWVKADMARRSGWASNDGA